MFAKESLKQYLSGLLVGNHQLKVVWCYVASHTNIMSKYAKEWREIIGIVSGILNCLPCCVTCEIIFGVTFECYPQQKNPICLVTLLFVPFTAKSNLWQDECDLVCRSSSRSWCYCSPQLDINPRPLQRYTQLGYLQVWRD